MPVGIKVWPEQGESNVPILAVFDATELGLQGSLASGGTSSGNPVEVSGSRRYRLKIVSLTGAGPFQVAAQDIPLSLVVANAFETVILAAAMAAGARSTFNFGEGTANLTNFCGAYLAIQLVNNGPDAATFEIELWAQG